MSCNSKDSHIRLLSIPEFSFSLMQFPLFLLFEIAISSKSCFPSGKYGCIWERCFISLIWYDEPEWSSLWWWQLIPSTKDMAREVDGVCELNESISFFSKWYGGWWSVFIGGLQQNEGQSTLLIQLIPIGLWFLQRSSIPNFKLVWRDIVEKFMKCVFLQKLNFIEMLFLHHTYNQQESLSEHILDTLTAYHTPWGI